MRYQLIYTPTPQSKEANYMHSHLNAAIRQKLSCIWPVNIVPNGVQIESLWERIYERWGLDLSTENSLATDLVASATGDYSQHDSIDSATVPFGKLLELSPGNSRVIIKQQQQNYHHKHHLQQHYNYVHCLYISVIFRSSDWRAEHVIPSPEQVKYDTPLVQVYPSPTPVPHLYLTPPFPIP